MRPDQWGQMESLADWLKDEAIVAGGLGPHEADRIWSRHLADSIVFCRGWQDSTPPRRLIDVGGGVGLPSIPLAILWPQTEFTLLDRAGRRIDLARRAVRRLGLDNVEVRQGDVLAEQNEWDGAVFRAVFPPARALQTAETVLEPTGIAVIGLRGTKRPKLPAARGGRPISVVEVPRAVLDEPVSILIMGPCEH